MEQLFAVRVLVHYYDKPKVDHAAVRRLLSAAAVSSLQLLLSDGSTTRLSVYIDTPPPQRKVISDVVDSNCSSLVQVASVFMLAEARAASDAICTSPNELETACIALERLLGGLITTFPQLPFRDINLAARVKLGTAARRRALNRISSLSSSDSHPSILKAVNTVLRLCDVATHCLAVVSRQCLSSMATCEVAVNLSTRLLTLASSLHEAQRVDCKPALSFFSSNSLRTALVSGALHLGAITIEHLSIEPMTWIHVANRIVTSSVITVPQRTSIMSALFGGMIRVGKAYESSDRDLKAAERAVCLLSTLHVILETDISRNIYSRQRESEQALESQSTSNLARGQEMASNNSGTISQAARSFLGERVIAAEEDGDEGRIAARTVYQACEEYAERSGETEGVMGLLCRLFEAAGRQSGNESLEETVVSLSDTALNLTCPPDESDASSDGPHARSDGTPFAIDVFDQRVKDGFGTVTTIASNGDDVVEPTERVELHRQIGALALDTVAHWVNKSHMLRRYDDFDVVAFSVQICKAASQFSFGQSSSSFDLQTAMSDFGTLLGPEIVQRLSEFPIEHRETNWRNFVSTLIGACQRPNPILSNVMRFFQNTGVVTSLLASFLDNEPDVALQSDERLGLPLESILQYLLKAIRRETSLQVVKTIVNFLMLNADSDCRELPLLSHRAACFILLSYVIYSHAGLEGKASQLTRQALVGLFNCDGDFPSEFIHPKDSYELEDNFDCFAAGSLSPQEAREIFHLLTDVPYFMESVCHRSYIFQDLPASLVFLYDQRPLERDASSFRRLKGGYYLLRSFVMTHHALVMVEKLSGLSFASKNVERGPTESSSLNPSFCLRATDTVLHRRQLSRIVEQGKESSIEMMFVTECASLMHIRTCPPTNSSNAFFLLKSLLRNALNLVSALVASDTTGNFSKLEAAFRVNSSISAPVEAEKDQSCRQLVTSGNGPLNLSYVQLAMCYICMLREGKASEMLAHVISTATQLLDHLSKEDIESGRFLICDVLRVVLFVPSSLNKLPSAMLFFIEKYLCLAFPDSGFTPESLKTLMDFMCRVCGLAEIVTRVSRSASGIQAFCTFASQSFKDSDFDKDALASSFQAKQVPETFGTISDWLKSSLPRVCLKDMLSTLLMSVDESAVTVSTFSQSLSLLTEACKLSSLWRTGVLAELHDLFCSRETMFMEYMVQRSIMQSATMHDVVISLFEEVVGPGDSEYSLSVLMSCFKASRKLFEEEVHASFESRVRLLNFAVRVSLMHGHICALRGENSLQLIEVELFSLIFSSLRKSLVYIDKEGTDETWKNIVIFLCLLLDSIQCGLNNDQTSVFDCVSDFHPPDVKHASTKNKPKPDIKIDQRGVNHKTANSPSSFSPTRSEDLPASRLCTYITTGDQYVEQHWYFCYTCDLAGSDGVCSVCARVCHKGCELAYSKFSRFFCDCGHGSDNRSEGSGFAQSPEDRDGSNSNSHGVTSQKSRPVPVRRRKPCICLKQSSCGDSKSKVHPASAPNKTGNAASKNVRELVVGASLRKKLWDELGAMNGAESSDLMKKRFGIIKQKFSELLQDKEAAKCLVTVALRLMDDLEGCNTAIRSPCQWIDIDRLMTYMQDLYVDNSFRTVSSIGKKIRSHKLLKPGSIDVSTSSGTVTEIPRGSLISYTPFQNISVVSAKSGLLEFIDLSDTFLLHDSISEKTLAASFGRTCMSYSVSKVSFHPENSNIILVSGDNRVSVVYRVGEDGSPNWKHFDIEVGLTEFDGCDGRNDLVSAEWIDGEASLILVVSENFVKIFDVAVDTFCPSFYTKIPKIERSKSEVDTSVFQADIDTKPGNNGVNTPSRRIISASVIRNPFRSHLKRDFAVFLLVSDGGLFLARTKTNESTVPSFKFCFSVSPQNVGEANGVEIIHMRYLFDKSLFYVMYSNGSALLVSVVVKFDDGDLGIGIRSARMYKEALPNGQGIETEPVPGTGTKIFFFQNGKPLSGCGMIGINENQEAEVHYFSGNSSASVLGLTSFAASTLYGGPLENGAFIFLDDGSIQRVYTADAHLRPQAHETPIFIDIVDRRSQRALRSLQGSSDSPENYSPIPDPIGFFEKSRLVSEQISIEGFEDGSATGLNFERMGVILAGESGECVVSVRENQPFRFSASINNKSLVLVGARLRFGGTERSRNRIPLEVKVFGRIVKSFAKNGVKRWVDVPFTVSESTSSPQKVIIELVPRRSTLDTKPACDGLVAIDCLELHAISDVEFIERKLTFETERAHQAEILKKKREALSKDRLSRFTGHGIKAQSCSGYSLTNMQFSLEQATILAVVQSVSKDCFCLLDEGGRLVFEVNGLWSMTYEGSLSRNPTFLKHLLKSCLMLISQPEHHRFQSVSCSDASNSTLSLLADGSRRIVDEAIVQCYQWGMFPSIGDIEKCLFSVSGICRSLFVYGCDLDFSVSQWCKKFVETMPSAGAVLSLLNAHMNLGRNGRVMYKSLQRTNLNAVDIVFFEVVREYEFKSSNHYFAQVLVDMLCSHDQYMRLATGQRLLELFDSLDGTTDFDISPLENEGASEMLEGSNSKAPISSGMNSEPAVNEDPDGTQSWAYRCDSCGEVCDQEWWHCSDCEDFDLCTTCLRGTNDALDGFHREDHILLRGTVEDDVNYQSGSEARHEVGGVVLAVQNAVAAVVDGVLQQMNRGSLLHKWRFLDAAETMAQLLGPYSPPELRESRLEALFKSSFPEALRKECESFSKEIGDIDRSVSTPNSALALSGSTVALLLLLKILLCSRGSAMALYIHRHQLPSLLVKLLATMHTHLRHLVHAMENVNKQCVEIQTVQGVMGSGVWNENVPLLSYDLLSSDLNSKTCRPGATAEVITDGDDSTESTFFAILTEVLHVLNYAYRSASSSSITEEMKKIPRNILCDIINCSETSNLENANRSVFSTASSAATQLLSVLSLDNTEAVNDILDKYLYEEQARRLRDSLGDTDLTEDLPYNALVEIANVLENLHKAAHRHPTTWKNFSLVRADVVYDVYCAAKILDGQVQVHALQLLAAGLSVSFDLSSRAIRGLPISELECSYQNSSKKMGNSDSGPANLEKAEPSVLKDSWTVSELIRAGRAQVQGSERIYAQNNFEMIRYLIICVMLKSQDRSARRAASQVVVFALSIASVCNDEMSTFLKIINDALLNGLELMQFSGELADGFMHCLRFFISCCQENFFGSASAPLLTALTVKVMNLLNERCSALISHPNARLYCRLSEILDLSGYYLEADPCMACATATWEASGSRDCRLDMVRAETKYTDSSIMHRLISPHEVHGVSVKVVDPRRTKRAKQIDVYFSMRTVSDAAELKSIEHPWKKLKSLHLGINATEASLTLTVPVAIANMKLAFVDFHYFTELPSSESTSTNRNASSTSRESGSARRSGNGRSGENLQCPRCSRSVTDRHGICRNCHENAYQCRQCRNINYENLDGFLCNECGYCKHSRFEFSINGRATHVAEAIRNEDDRKRASKTIEKETSNVHRCMEQLGRIRSSIIKSLISGNPNDDSNFRSRAFISSRVGLADLLDSMTPRPEIAVLEALLEGQVGQEIEETSQGGNGVSVTEETLAEGSSTDAHDREHSQRSGSNVASPINRPSRVEPNQKNGSEVTGFNKSASAIAATYAKECRTIFSAMCRGIRVLTMTRTELIRYANRVGGNRLLDITKMSNSTFALNSTDVEKAQGLQDQTVSNEMSSCCYGCTQSFIAKGVLLLQAVLRQEGPVTRIVRASSLAKNMLLVCPLCERREIRGDICEVITLMVNDNMHSTQLVCDELDRKIGFCIDSYKTVDTHSIARFEMAILESTSTLDDSCWEERLKLVIRILFKASVDALTCSSVAESIILPCLRVASRLTRSDSELTVIESRSPTEVSVAPVDSVTSTGALREAVDTSETDNEELDTAGPIGQLLQESVDGDVSVRLRTLHSNLVRMFGYDVNDGGGGSIVGGNASLGPRESSRNEERRMHQRQGSDVMTSSRAPSSIGTAFDGHVSDEELEVPQERTEMNVNMEIVQSVLEKAHDGKQLTANVLQWLEGKQSHSSWIADMIEKTYDLEEREKSLTSSDGITPLSVKTIFDKWKQLHQRNWNVKDDSQYADPLSNILSIDKGNWIVRLMLFTPCRSVRKEACTLLELLCGQEEMLQLQLLDILAGPSLSLGANVGEKSKEYFDLLESTLSSRNHRLYLIGKGFLPRIAALIQSKAARLIQCEVESDASTKMVNFMEGYSLKRLVSVLRLSLEVIPAKRPSLREKLLEHDNNKIVKCLQSAYLYVRKLISLKTRLTEDCGTELCEVLLSKDFLFAGSTVTAIVSACVTELKAANDRNDAQGGAILLDELCQMLCPERREPTCLVILNKAPTQEEFIRGSMSRNPYSSASFDGPLMRDVKNKICKDLDLPALLEDDFAMELLVAGKVVKLDLPILAVYEHVWREAAPTQIPLSAQPTHLSRSIGLRRTVHGGPRMNTAASREVSRGTLLSIHRINSERDNLEDGVRTESRADPPMVVVYRLSGLDGEATEPIVDSLPTARDDEQNSEELYRDTIVLGRVGGFDVLFQLLAVVGSWGDDAETAVRAPALRLLRASCEVSQNRAMLAKSPVAVGTLLDCAASAFEHAQGSPAAVASAESLLIAAEQILAQQRDDMEIHATIQRDAVQLSSHGPEEVSSRVEVFLKRLEIATSPTAEYSILHLLPFLIQGMRSAIDLVLEHLCFSWDSVEYASNDQRKAKQLGTVLFATPRDLRGNAFVTQTIQVGTAEKSVDYLINKFPLPKNENVQKWNDALDENAVPLILKVLTGLCLFLDCEAKEAGDLLRDIIHGRTGFFSILSQLEMAVSDNSVGTCAEELLEELSRDKTFKSEIDEEREAIKRARREAARASRIAILQEAGLPTLSEGAASFPKNINIAVSPETHRKKVAHEDSILKMMNDLPDEVGPACVVCGDGFRCRPEEALALYVFCKKMPLELGIRNADNGPTRKCEGGNVNQGVNRIEWEVWSSGRSRGSGGGGSRSGSSCFTSVTHMNPIHMGCHREAARMDRTSRRDEWDGASLRNSQTRCNNLFPIRPPVTIMEGTEIQDDSVRMQALTSYNSAVEGYFSRLSSIGRTNLSQTKIVVYDLGRSLLRFSDGGTTIFSEFSKGGGAHSNASLIPHMVQLVLYVMEGHENGHGDGGISVNQASLQTQQAALKKFLDENEVGDLTYYLASALILQDLNDWSKNIDNFLRRGLRDGVLGRTQVLRLIAFSDLVNHSLKRDINNTQGSHWLHALRRHIGMDETFAERFGDVVNEHWEARIRKIESDGDFLTVLQQNFNALTHADQTRINDKLLDRLTAVL